MPLRVKFSQNTLNSKNRNIILTPKETNDHTVVFLNKNNRYEFLIPLRVDLKESILEDLTFDLEVQNDTRIKRPIMLSESSLAPTTEQLDKLKMLPGQLNSNSKTVSRIKQRREKLERFEGFNKSSGRDSNQGNNALRSKSDRKYQGKYESNSSARYGIKKSIILDNIHEGQQVQRDIVLFNKSKTIKKKRIDYTNKISNKKVRMIKNKKNKKTDDELFGYTKSYKLGKPNNPGIDMSSQVFFSNIEVGANVLSKGTNSLGNNKIEVKNRNRKSQSAEKLINKHYISKKDPAVIFEGVPTHRSVKNIEKGTRPKLGVKRSGKKGTVLDKINPAKSLRENLVRPELTLVNKIVGNGNKRVKTGVRGEGSFEIADNKINKNRKKKPFVYSQKEINRRALIYVNYILKDDHVFNGKVNLVVKCYNKKGLKLMDKIIDLNALEIIEKQLSIPEKLPTLRVSKNRHSNFARVEVFNGSPNNIKYSIYRKILEPAKNVQSLNYKLVLEGSVKPTSSVREKIDQYHNLDCLYRMTYEIVGKSDSIRYSNFSNDMSLMAHPGNSSRYVTLEADIVNSGQDEHITVEVRNLPPDTDSVKLLRKSISNVNRSNKMQKMEYVIDPNNDSRVQIKKPDLNRMVTFVDRGVVDNTTYEYRAEILLDRGTKHVSTNCIREKFQERLDILTPFLGVSDDIDQNSGETNSNIKIKGISKVFMDVDAYSSMTNETRKINLPTLKFDKQKTIADSLVDTLSKKGDVFTDDLKKIKDATNVQGGATVTLINKTNGSRFHLGDLKEGQPLITKTASINNEDIRPNCEYSLKIEPFETSTKDTIDKIAKILSQPKSLTPGSVAVGKFSSIRRSALASIKKARGRNLNFKKDRTKFFSKRRLKRGVIEPSDRTLALASSAVKSDFIDLDYTGDILNIKFDTNRVQKFSAIPVETYVSPHHNVVLTFKVRGNLNDIDFIIISAKKDDDYFPVGSAHCDKTDSIYNFLDYTSADYLGGIEYYAQAVYESGEVADQRYKIGEAVLIEKFNNPMLLKNKKVK